MQFSICPARGSIKLNNDVALCMAQINWMSCVWWFDWKLITPVMSWHFYCTNLTFRVNSNKYLNQWIVTLCIIMTIGILRQNKAIANISKTSPEHMKYVTLLSLSVLISWTNLSALVSIGFRSTHHVLWTDWPQCGCVIEAKLNNICFIYIRLGPL